MVSHASLSFLGAYPFGKEDPYVIGHDGTRYDRILFDSPLHQQLTLKLKDTDKANHIWKCYQTEVLPLIPASAQEILEKWLPEHIFTLTCRHEDHVRELKSIHELAPFIPVITHFFSKISCQEHDHSKEKKTKPRTIVIIATSGAGGELMVAKSIEQYLKSRSFTVHCLDPYQLLKNERNPLYRFSGMYSGDIYGEIFQKENDPNLSDALWEICKKLNFFIPDNSSRMIKDALRELKPDLILSTRYVAARDAALAYDLNVPLKFVHCDYRFSPALLPLASVVHSQLIKFWVPTRECIPGDIALQDRVEVLGYPIRLGIVKNTDNASLDRLRQKLEINPEEKVLLMMMGRQGFGKVLLPLIQKINTSGLALGPLHVVIVCGNNAGMQQELSQYVTTTPGAKNVTFKVLGLLDEEALSEYYNVAHVLLGKAGGSTTAELAYMGIFGLICESYELEIPNFEYLLQIGLGTKLNQNTFVDQLRELLGQDKSVPVHQINWQEQICQLIE